jgi:hypothetical protein
MNRSSESRWRQQRIECVRFCTENHGFLCLDHAAFIFQLQGCRCAVCDRRFFPGVKPYPNADHEHRDAPRGKGRKRVSRGPFRGFVCGGNFTSCNRSIIAQYERYPKNFAAAHPEAAEAVRRYLKRPPRALFEILTKQGLIIQDAAKETPREKA